MTTIHSRPPTTPTPDFEVRPRRKTDTTDSTQQMQANSAARLTATMHDPAYMEMYNTLQKMTPTPTFDAIRGQVPDNVWNAKQGTQSYGLDTLLMTPMAREMGLKLREQHGDLFPGMDELSWASIALTALLTKGMHGDPGTLAGFDFDSRGNKASDEMAANMFSRVKQHLIDTGQASPELANALAFLLLWRSSPEYLLKHIPADLSRFDVQWEQVRAEVSKMSEKHDRAPLGASYEGILDDLAPQRVIDRSQF